jgi:hypothetical protein
MRLLLALSVLSVLPGCLALERNHERRMRADVGAILDLQYQEALEDALREAQGYVEQPQETVDLEF